MKNKKTKRSLLGLLILCVIVVVVLYFCLGNNTDEIPASSAGLQDQQETLEAAREEIIQIDSVPEFSGEPYCVINGNSPQFTEADLTAEAYESYSDLDEFSRCGTAIACVGKELMPTEDRESISHVKPSGWVNVPYDFVDGKYLYNRCHLIGFQLTGENDNEKNLITGTRYMNVEGMLPFENMIADYVKETGNHVMYRVTPVFQKYELVACGVQMEAWSVEDDGEGICFNVYAYNVQPGVEIDYATGESHETELPKEESGVEKEEYILNTSSKKFHLKSCSGAEKIDPSNRKEFAGKREDLIADGYSPCGQCNP